MFVCSFDTKSALPISREPFDLKGRYSEKLSKISHPTASGRIYRERFNARITNFLELNGVAFRLALSYGGLLFCCDVYHKSRFSVIFLCAEFTDDISINC